MSRHVSRLFLVFVLIALGAGLAACGSSTSESESTTEAAAPAEPAATTATAAALTEYEQFAVDLINDPTNGFAPGFKDLTGSDAPAVPADIQCMVTTSDTDETQAQVMLWSGTGSDYSVVIVPTNGLELMNSSTSSYGTLFGSTASEQEFPPPTTGTPCTVNEDWTIAV